MPFRGLDRTDTSNDANIFCSVSENWLSVVAGWFCRPSARPFCLTLRLRIRRRSCRPIGLSENEIKRSKDQVIMLRIPPYSMWELTLMRRTFYLCIVARPRFRHTQRGGCYPTHGEIRTTNYLWEDTAFVRGGTPRNNLADKPRRSAPTAMLSRRRLFWKLFSEGIAVL
jgi:hypothetical protein